ncbi:MAG: rhomboid family intramembrane serine protease [Salinivirgaceae bacterium]|nr:rhomboid family intramembrane serine protease [Salinivirgaceae bacterium]
MQPYRAPIFGNLPLVIKNLLILNVLVFAADNILPLIGINITHLLALHNVQSEYFKPFQFVTHMFMHGDVFHIFFNMFALYMFGRVLEVVWGPKRFLIYYFVTGLGAAALHSFVSYLGLADIREAANAFANTPSPEVFMTFVREFVPNANASLNEFINSYSMQPNNPLYINEATQFVHTVYEAKINIPTVGASGAVFGVLLAFGMLFPNTQLMLLFPPIPIKAKYFVIIYGAIELFAAVMQQPGDNVAHFAHLGGMLFGFILIKYWNSKGYSNYKPF